MIVGSTGFSFGGVHSRDDMGLIYAEKDGHVMIPEIKRNAYQIAGMSGTVLMPGEAWQTFFLEGTLYPVEEPRTQAEAQQLLRRITTWLTAGRQQLIFDYEPGVYYLAELSTQSKWSLRNWFGGELPIRFTVQPFAYSVQQTAAVYEITSEGRKALSFRMETGRPAPLQITVENAGTATITDVAVGSGIAFSGMQLGQGKILTISCEPPIGAEIGQVDFIGTDSAMPWCDALAPIMLENGANSVPVALSFGSGTRQAKVTVSARGRW